MESFTFSEGARQVWLSAVRVARRHGEPFVDTDHLLLAALEDEGGVACRGLAAAGIQPSDVRHRLGDRRGADGDVSGALPPTPEVLAVRNLASREAAELGDEQIRPEHFLLALCRHRRGLAQEILRYEFGLTSGVLRRAVLSERP